MLEWLFDSPLVPGTSAPDFTLADQDGVEHTLSRLRGKNVVLVFYPADETITCRKQLCEFRDRSQIAASKETIVFGINPGARESHARFRDNHRLGFPLLVDEGKKVAARYHCGGPVVRRTVYLVGKDGIVKFGKRGKPLPEDVLGAADA